MAVNDVMQSNPDLLPIEFANEVIAELPQASAVMALSRVRRMSTRQSRMPASAALAAAYWVGNSANDFTNLKQTTKAEWAGVNLIVEDLAVLVAIPNAFAQDSGFPIWTETKPQVVEALGAALDAAVLFGVNAPDTWQSSIFEAIPDAQKIETGTTDDLASDIALSAQTLKQRGFNSNGFAVEPGFGWGLIGLRSADGLPIYSPNLQDDGPTGRLYGQTMQEVANGSWVEDDATVIHGDWSKSIVGIRQDIEFTEHPSGVINDSEGAVVFNAMQQDSTVWRAVMRVAWARANPATRLGPQAGYSGSRTPSSDAAPIKFPWGAIVPAGS